VYLVGMPKRAGWTRKEDGGKSYRSEQLASERVFRFQAGRRQDAAIVFVLQVLARHRTSSSTPYQLVLTQAALLEVG
jgi:hypothetical protein